MGVSRTHQQAHPEGQRQPQPLGWVSDNRMSGLFTRRYWGNRSCFLFLRRLICLSSARAFMLRQVAHLVDACTVHSGSEQSRSFHTRPGNSERHTRTPHEYTFSRGRWRGTVRLHAARVQQIASPHGGCRQKGTTRFQARWCSSQRRAAIEIAGLVPSHCPHKHDTVTVGTAGRYIHFAIQHSLF